MKWRVLSARLARAVALLLLVFVWAAIVRRGWPVLALGALALVVAALVAVASGWPLRWDDDRSQWLALSAMTAPALAVVGGIPGLYAGLLLCLGAMAVGPRVVVGAWSVLTVLAGGLGPRSVPLPVLVPAIVAALVSGTPILLARRRAAGWLREITREREREFRLAGEKPRSAVRQLAPEAVAVRRLEREAQLARRLGDVVRAARRALSAHTALMYLRGPDDSLRLIAYDSVFADVQLEPILRPGEGAAGNSLVTWVFRQAEPFAAAELAKPLAGATHHRDMHAVRSFLGVPVGEDQCIGVLAVESLELQMFSGEETRQSLVLLAQQVQQWIAQHDETAAVAEELEHWRAFFEVAQELQKSEGTAGATKYFLDLVDIVTHADLSVILERRPDGGFRVVDFHGELATVSIGREIGNDESYVAWALAQEKARGDEDLSRRKIDLPLLAVDDGIPREGSVVCVPFFRGDDPVPSGGLMLWSRRPRQFGSASAAMLERLVAPFALAYDRAQATKQLHDLATTDGLTGVLNRRAAMEQLRLEIERVARTGQDLAVILIDVDKFKAINDTHGHAAGDAVLRSVAAVLRAGVRGVDVVARYGGEEFLVVLPQTDAFGALKMAERLRKSLAKQDVRIENGSILRVTASFGVAALAGAAETDEQLLRRADQGLYAAKEAGRNRVVLAPSDDGQG